MKKAKVLIGVVVVLLSACSNRAMYDTMQQHQRKECLDEQPAAYQECIERTNKSYKEYERERQQQMKDKPVQPI